MGPSDPASAILRINLGTAAAFDQKDFPLAYYQQEGNFNKGSFLIRATLEEMEKIKQLGIDLNKNQDFIFDTRLDIEDLKAERAKLQDNRKTLNPIKAFLTYRAARMFHAASRTVYLQTRSKSEKIHRDSAKDDVQVVPSTQMRIVNDAVPSDTVIHGFSVELQDGLNDDAKRTIDGVMGMIAKVTNPFNDSPLVSQLRDGEQEITLADTTSLLSQDMLDSGIDESSRTFITSSDLRQSHPTSPQTIIHCNIIQNSIVTTNSSNLTGFTTNSGQRNSDS